MTTPTTPTDEERRVQLANAAHNNPEYIKARKAIAAKEAAPAQNATPPRMRMN